VKRKFYYRVEVQAKTEPPEWWALSGLLQVSLDMAEGYVQGRRDGESPRRPMRVVRYPADQECYSGHKSAQAVPTDEVVTLLDEGSTEVRIGMLPQGFGYQWPAYLSAARRALERARSDVRDPEARAMLDTVTSEIDVFQRRGR